MKKLVLALAALAAVATASAADQYRASVFAGAGYASNSASKTHTYVQTDTNKAAHAVDTKVVGALNNSLSESGLGFSVGADAHYFLTYTNGVKLGVGGLLNYTHSGSSDTGAELTQSFNDLTKLTHATGSANSTPVQFKVKSSSKDVSSNVVLLGLSGLAQFQPVEGVVPFVQLAVGPAFGSVTQKVNFSTAAADAKPVDANSNATLKSGETAVANAANTYEVSKLGYGLYAAVGGDYQLFSAKLYAQFANLRAGDVKELKSTAVNQDVQGYKFVESGDSLKVETSAASTFQVGLQLGVNF